MDRQTELNTLKKNDFKKKFVQEKMPISAQGYGRMSVEDRELLKKAFVEEGKDYDEYLEEAKKGWPAVTNPKPIRWRDGKSGRYL